MSAFPFRPASASGRPTGALALADGTVLLGEGVGAVGTAVGEVCFNTAITGYQEILTDPSYAAQIVTFTFPHVGNVGTNDEDGEASAPAASVAARGAVFRQVSRVPSNWRARQSLPDWLAARGIVGLSGIDTRALTILIREKGMQNAVIAHDPAGITDTGALVAQARAWGGLEGLDLARDVSTAQTYQVAEGRWRRGQGFVPVTDPRFEVVVLDYGVKRNILRALGDVGARATVVPATTTADEVLARRPDGVLISNGPGDPAATARAYAADTIRGVLEAGVPTFGICLGHQMLALAMGGRTLKMAQGHHGANHPVKDLETGKVEIVSMNHGFAVDADSLPAGVRQTHVSLFDGTNCGLALDDRPAFSVQYHPEASPGPQDSHYLFERFARLMQAHR
jgi:carbamoyl-phosphate synthase small subunit